MSGWTSNLGGNPISNGTRSVTIRLSASRLVGSFAGNCRWITGKIEVDSLTASTVSHSTACKVKSQRSQVMCRTKGESPPVMQTPSPRPQNNERYKRQPVSKRKAFYSPCSSAQARMISTRSLQAELIVAEFVNVDRTSTAHKVNQLTLHQRKLVKPAVRKALSPLLCGECVQNRNIHPAFPSYTKNRSAELSSAIRSWLGHGCASSCP
jgi:hypothetical protein